MTSDNDVPRTRRVGIPRFEGFGIHARWEKSDQRQWTVECDHCGEEVVPDFFKHARWRVEGDDQDTVRRWGKDDTSLEVVEAWRACHECETPLDVANGRWVPRYPGRRVIGFHLTRMCIPLTDLEETLGALSDLVRQGKVRMIGCCTFPPSEIVESQLQASEAA